MVESRVGEIQNFATEIIDKVTFGAMDIADANSDDAVAGLPLSDARSMGCGRCGDPKSRNRSLRSARRSSEGTKKKCSCDEPKKSQTLEMNLSSAYDDNDAKVSDEQTNEEIRKIVEGLRGVRIGDSRLVGPVERVTSLERQIKRAVVEMQNAIRPTTETNVEAQGDAGDAENFCQTVANSAIETIPEADQLLPVNIAKLEDCSEKRKSESQIRLCRQTNQRIEPEVSNLRSTCFLHRMIKELEDAEANRVNLLAASPSTTAPATINAASINEVSQERIAAWEESEERFIRIIEGSGENDGNASIDTEIPATIETSFAICPLENAPVEAAVVLDVQIEKLESKTTSRPVTPTLILLSNSPEERPPETTESILLADRSPQGTLERSKPKNKKNLAGRLRRFFSSAFKRSKD